MAAKRGVEMVKQIAEYISKGSSFDRVTQMVMVVLNHVAIFAQRKQKTMHKPAESMFIDVLRKQTYR